MVGPEAHHRSKTLEAGLSGLAGGTQCPPFVSSLHEKLFLCKAADKLGLTGFKRHVPFLITQPYIARVECPTRENFSYARSSL